MKTSFYNKKITGILGILPENSYEFVDEMEGGVTSRNLKIMKNMGYGKRYRAKGTTTTADLCVQGTRFLFENNVIFKEEIGAIVVVTFTPDYFVPNVSNLIHKRCDLSQDVYAVDIISGCSGYADGLFEALSLLDQIHGKKILLYTSDIINRKVVENEPKYKSPPYGGDGASITILENCKEETKIDVVRKTDGTHKDIIAITQGGFFDLFHENKLKRNGILGDPNASFRFFQEKMPLLMEEAIAYSDISIDDIDYFAFIQANKLMPKKFADKLHIPYEKFPMDAVEKYGDSSATLNAFVLLDILKENKRHKEQYQIMIGGYGSGAKMNIIIMKIDTNIYFDILKTDL